MKKCNLEKRSFVLPVLVFVLMFGCAGSAAAKDILIVADQYYATTMDPIGHNDMPSSRVCY